uniref:U30-Hexatoxin-Hf1a_1 n=1 Tax=Hadronyche formidabilis TaxID=426499 RepID=A0A4Q8K2L5_HADFO
MKLYLVILVTSVALVAASPTRNKEEPTENDLLEALLRVEQSLYNEETTVTEERTSCVIGWKQQGQTCERDCECCGVAATCIGDEKPRFCGYRTTNNNLGQYILYGILQFQMVSVQSLSLLRANHLLW